MGFDPILWSKLKALQEDVANIVSGSIPEGYIPTGINEYDTKTDFPRPGSSGALYIAKNTNLVYCHFARLRSTLLTRESCCCLLRFISTYLKRDTTEWSHCTQEILE